MPVAYRIFAFRNPSHALSGTRVPSSSGRTTLLLFLVLSAELANIHKVAADTEAEKNKAVPCSDCHGEGRIAETENIPSLAAQPAQFPQWQLVYFRSGARKSEVMGPVAEQLGNDDVRDLAAYFAALRPPESSATKSPDGHPGFTAAGKKAVAAGRCVSCHGDNFAGSKAVARIAGQREDHLLKGLRIGGGVAAMADVAYQLSEQDIAALAQYLSRL
jgi:cytochrome c553